MRFNVFSARLLALLIFLVPAGAGFAQEADSASAPTPPPSPWKFTGNVSLTFNQVALLNWVAGGENSISGEAAALFKLEYKDKRHLWTNVLDAGYGLMKQENALLVKNQDRIEFTSQYGFEAGKSWYYSALAGLKSQFAPGYKNPQDSNRVRISDVLSPLYFTLSLGISYSPEWKFTMLLSPLTGKLTYVHSQQLANQGAFGVQKAHVNDEGVWVEGEKLRWELGAFLKFGYVNRFFKEQFGVASRLEFFSNYLEKPENVDVFFDLVLDYKLLSFLTAKAQFTMLYDDDQRILQPDGRMIPKLQLRQMFGVGLAYHF